MIIDTEISVENLAEDDDELVVVKVSLEVVSLLSVRLVIDEDDVVSIVSTESLDDLEVSVSCPSAGFPIGPEGLVSIVCGISIVLM
ncbi:hypothetical protein AYI70_g6362 [Smittium culicis]|uniref:Uncharacterized protein n=1 Tax=Smittium culicis TaxID=133412 RepID=A0A1R1XQA2_9FUNG|nr:hypothetical protein AYI70_g6362 [Smittium culicis]